MSVHNIGIRKYVEGGKVRYWLLVNAKPSDQEGLSTSSELKFTKKLVLSGPLLFINSPYWKIFIIMTVLVNSFSIFIVKFDDHKPDFFDLWISHTFCFFYWIDFLGGLTEKIIENKKKIGLRTRSMGIVVVDAISLIPLSLTYLMTTSNPDESIFILLRSITILRIHKVTYFVYNLTMNARHHWKLMLINYLIVFILFTQAFSVFVYLELDHFSPIPIKYWNASNFDRNAVSWYFCVQTVLTVAFGDIVPIRVLHKLVCVVVAIVACSQLGIVTGILTTAFLNSDKVRESYRANYEATMKLLKDRKIDKKILDKISDNMMIRWKYNKGFTGNIDIRILPTSMQKEVCFDINFGLLSRSLIFSTQPRSFLRSVSLFMKNVSYLPGDIIMEPFGMTDAMLCVASGVIEILSEENDETVLFSLTSGTIIGEATLFLSIPIRCIIRASTYVELQVLMKVHFSRLALKYPDIIRSMRSEIYYRLNFRNYLEVELSAGLDSEFLELSRRKETKKFLQDLRKKNEKNFEGKKFRVNAYKSAILSLYVLSENIPAVKTLPIQLIRAKPWILRPGTTLMVLWDTFIVALVIVVVFLYPYYAAFERQISSELYVFMVFVEFAYVIDLYIECTTAIETKDKFTFITSIKEIIAFKLRRFGFYLDILATYDFSPYSRLEWFKRHEYAALLLSLNRVLKVWRVVAFFHKLEDNMKCILVLVRTIKFLFFFIVAVIWSAAFLYIEACPENACIKDRWFAQLKAKEEMFMTPRTKWPQTLSFYYSTVILSGISYGDISPTTMADIYLIMLILAEGVIILIVCMSQASSTFKHIASVRSNYQLEVFAVDRFISEHDIPKHLKEKVADYLQLQWNYDKGFLLINNGMTEGLPPQQRYLIVTELMKPFLTVPLFRTAGNDFLRVLARSSQVRLLPPNDVITEGQSSNREMFILENGYCEVSTNEETKVIGPVNPFGYYEMIVGIPLQIRVTTLTHVRIITLNYTSYLRAVTKYPSIKAQINDIIEKEFKGKISHFGTLGFPPLEDNDPSGEKVKMQKELLSNQFINVYTYNNSIGLSYWEPFREWGRFRFCQFLFFPFVVVPNSLFIKIWTSLRIINVILIGLVAPVYFSLPNYMQSLHPLLISLQVFAAVDMYLMFHLAYYDTQGLLMFHPVKTVTWYLKGTFIIDLLTLCPHHWIVRKIIPPSDNTPSLLYDGLGMIIVLQFYKFIQGCFYLKNDILRTSEIITILKFVALAIIMSNCITGIMVLIECYEIEDIDVTKLQESNTLAIEWKKSITMFCLPDVYQNESAHLQVPVFKMYLTALYWVTQTTAGCGFGDITAHNRITMIASIVIIFLGLFLYMYMFADLTSGMITAYVLVTKYRSRISEMSDYLKEKEIDASLHKRMVLHYEYNWQRTEGTNPQKMFTCVHAVLRHIIMARIYEDTVREVPGFVNVANSVIRVIGQHLNETYFLQGETIINYKDIQEHIYLLYRGKVRLSTADGEVITTMGRGGLFGNVSNTPFSLSSVVAVATTNVDVLRLDCKTFFKALEVSSNTKNLLDFLTSKKRDYIVPLNVSEKRTGTVHSTLTQMETIPYELNTLRSVRPWIRFSDINLTKAQSSFYFKNSVFKEVGRRFCTFVILPETALYNFIEIMVVILAYISSVLTVYSFAFQEYSMIMLVISYALDLFFYFKVGLQYHMSHFDKFGDYVINTHIIKKRYHKSRAMIYDILSNIPLEIFVLAVPKKWQLPSLSAFRMNRVIRLAFILEYHNMKLQTLMVNKIILELCWILICTSLMIHFFTCLWYFVVCPMGRCHTPCFVSEMKLEGKKGLELYVVSLYYIVLIMTTVSYGGIPLYSTRELVLSVTLIISSRFAVVLLIGTLTAALNAQNDYLYFYQDRITRLKESFFNQNISEYQIHKMWSYMQSLWFFKSWKQIPKFITSAPYALRCEVMDAMFGSHLSHLYIFAEVEKEFLRQLSIYLRRFVYFPGNYIVHQGDIDHTMYFIYKGKVSVLMIHPDLTETVHFNLAHNDSFGVIQGLIVGTPHHFSYRAQSEVVILSLTLSHWKHLLKYFPQAEALIYKNVHKIPSPQDNATL